MSQVFSRDYLQGLLSATREAAFERLIRPILDEVGQAARAGKISYAFSMQLASEFWTADELLPLFKEKFPGCTVTYEVKWVDGATRVFSNHVVVDWS